MTSFLPNTFAASPQSPASHVPTFCAAQLRFLDEWKDPVVLNASTHRSIAFRSGIAPRRSTLNFRRKSSWTVSTESLCVLDRASS